MQNIYWVQNKTTEFSLMIERFRNSVLFDLKQEYRYDMKRMDEKEIKLLIDFIKREIISSNGLEQTMNILIWI